MTEESIYFRCPTRFYNTVYGLILNQQGKKIYFTLTDFCNHNGEEIEIGEFVLPPKKNPIFSIQLLASTN